MKLRSQKDKPLLQSLALMATVSRWRFWLYLGGTYLVGFTAGATDLSSFSNWMFWTHLAFFVLPANLLLYGINDIFDADTDALNLKKLEVEHRVEKHEMRTVCTWVAICCASALLLTMLQRSLLDSAVMLSFVVLAVAYSTPPVRLKSRPVLDSLSNILYAVPGFLGYQQASGETAGTAAVLIAGAWTASMHLFSAIPDIECDTRAGLSTTATLLGRRRSLAVCAFLWAAFAGALTVLRVAWPWSVLAWIYPVIPACLLLRPLVSIERVYWRFPILNGTMGAAAFFVLVAQL